MSQPIAQPTTELEQIRVYADALEHALYHTLVGVLETHVKIDPCPAIKLASDIAEHSIKRAKEEMAPELGRFAREDRAHAGELLAALKLAVPDLERGARSAAGPDMCDTEEEYQAELDSYPPLKACRAVIASATTEDKS